jgi:sec-independent protein translocase protein TatB
MFNVGGGEVLVILLLALIVLGPDKLPEFSRKVGRAVHEVRRLSSGFQSEMRQAMDMDQKPRSAVAPRLVDPPEPAAPTAPQAATPPQPAATPDEPVDRPDPSGDAEASGDPSAA